jgi:hypothetical protein
MSLRSQLSYQSRQRARYASSRCANVERVIRTRCCVRHRIRTVRRSRPVRCKQQMKYSYPIRKRLAAIIRACSDSRLRRLTSCGRSGGCVGSSTTPNHGWPRLGRAPLQSGAVSERHANLPTSTGPPKRPAAPADSSRSSTIRQTVDRRSRLRQTVVQTT